jgi:hypothetical protein
MEGPYNSTDVGSKSEPLPISKRDNFCCSFWPNYDLQDFFSEQIRKLAFFVRQRKLLITKVVFNECPAVRLKI